MNHSEASAKPYQGQCLEAVSLAKYTTWRVGGSAKQLYKPVGVADLGLFLAALPLEEPLLWLGLGSNSLIRDGGFQGTVILTQGCLKGLALLDEETFRVEAGVSCASLARFCARNYLKGGEFWAGIPGTLGGALRMNAGCFKKETWESVLEVETMDRSGQIHVRKPEDFDISYRHVILPAEEWFISATCRLEKGEKEASLQCIHDLLEIRAKTQPINAYNCGSVFRNPPGDFAARLIESCGLKGTQRGAAMVSLKHANFIINEEGKAQAADIEGLIQDIKAKVFDETEILLQEEVHILGEK